MKTKKLSKKLGLNKKTIADLNGKEMGYVKGRCIETHFKSCIPLTDTCITCGNTCNPTCDQATCATYTGNPQSDPCCNTC